MIALAYLLLLPELIAGQRSFLRGDGYGISPYLNLGPKPGAGVGVLQDLSNARILSNEPFIISFEFPNLGKSGDPRKSRFGSKRSRPQRKKNRRLRQFRHIVLPEGDLLERTKRLQILQRRPGYDARHPGLLLSGEGRNGKMLADNSGSVKPLDKANFGRFLKFDNEETIPKPLHESQKSILQRIIDSKKTEDNSSDETIEADNYKQWESIKSKWASLFPKEKESDNEVDEEEKLKLKSHKMWANCQLLKLLKAPQRNPYFYKLLPPNYPALIMNEEKQLQCNKVYDITDLSRDKKIIAEKIEQLEKILSSEFKTEDKVPERVPETAEEESGTRRKRDVQMVEKKREHENTLQDESLQGKSEGEGRSDRSRRTKERQQNRKRGEKRREGKRKQKEASRTKHDRHQNDNHGKTRSGRMAETGQITDNEIPKINKLEEKEPEITPQVDGPEKKREKQEIKKDSALQEVFKPTEVNKIIKQKELEANIFDKVVRAMKKYEENNPYDESFKPQKRESKNETETEVEKADSSEGGWEVDDAVRKLAKIFKILGVKAEAKKCTDCDVSEEDSSEEIDEKKIKKLKLSKSSRKCTCAEDCPFCQDCLKCFRECKKNSVTSKNLIWNKQAPYLDEYSGLIIEKKPENPKDGNTAAKEDAQDEVEADRNNLIKPERMYRTKLPPSRDLVRVFFDNPENKLLVWTKRGRRTMPWGPLTSDLQLYRDRARQILKSAEDILQRIKETEEKIHANEQYGDPDPEAVADKNKKEKVMDDIIKKVVNEENIFRTPWQVNKSENDLIGMEKITTEAKEQEKEADLKVDEEVAESESETPERVQDEEKLLPEAESVVEKVGSAGTESKSVEAEVESVEEDRALIGDVKDEGEDYEDFPAKVEAVSNKKEFEAAGKNVSVEKSEERSEEDERLEKVVGKGSRKSEESEEDEKLEKAVGNGFEKSGERWEEDETLEKSFDRESGKSEEAEEVEKLENSFEKESEKSEESEEIIQQQKAPSKQSLAETNRSTEEEEKSVDSSEPEVMYDDKVEQKHIETESMVKSAEEEKSEESEEDSYDLKEKYPDQGEEEEENIFQDQIRPIEENYIIKGVKQTNEEKEAILKALKNAEGNNIEIFKEQTTTESVTEDVQEIVEQTTIATTEQKDGDDFKTLMNHLSGGHMDEKDFEAVKKLDENKIDYLVGEMQKKDGKFTAANCDKQIKLCQIACGCNGANNSTTEIDKYDIIKGFLGWIKSVQMDQMVPISV